MSRANDDICASSEEEDDDYDDRAAQREEDECRSEADHARANCAAAEAFTNGLQTGTPTAAAQVGPVG